MRITNHNGRAGKNGVYSAKHNDRKFDTDKAEHIDQDRTSLNRYWQRDQEASSFEENEANFYEKYFRASLDAKNERYMAQRHEERCQTMEDYRKNEKSCPEETIMQIGKAGDQIDSDKLWRVMIEQVNWEQKHFPNCKYLDVALHRDEEGQDHIHLRKVWVAHDKDGNLLVGQKKALDEMGVEAPDPEKKITKFNNQKMTYSRECREHLIEMVREFYPEIEPMLELEPKEASKVGMELLEYQKSQEMEKLQELQAQLESARLQIAQLSSEKAEYDKKIKQAQISLQKAQKELKSVDMDREQLAIVKQQLKTAQNELKTTLDMKAKASVVKVHRFGEQKDLVTYHRNTLEDTEAIGRKAEEHMEQAYKYRESVISRERAVTKKEAEIEPLHKKASEELARAEELKREQESYIRGTAEKLAQDKINLIMRPSMDKYTRRMENFLDGYTVEGKSLLETFKAEEQALKHKLSYDIGLSL